jgi:hypothetical protein
MEVWTRLKQKQDLKSTQGEGGSGAPHPWSFNCCVSVFQIVDLVSGGELLEIRLLDNHLLYTFGSKSTARHKIYQLLESS